MHFAMSYVSLPRMRMIAITTRSQWLQLGLAADMYAFDQVLLCLPRTASHKITMATVMGGGGHAWT